MQFIKSEIETQIEVKTVQKVEQYDGKFLHATHNLVTGEWKVTLVAPLKSSWQHGESSERTLVDNELGELILECSSMKDLIYPDRNK
jgi:hypothetical protein